MNRYLFRFGFCTPAQWASNQAHGLDDENSSAFFVSAETEDAALDIGAEIAEQYVGYLFMKENAKEMPSWKASKFAFWIEKKPLEVFAAESLAQLPEVGLRQVPDFGRWN